MKAERPAKKLNAGAQKLVINLVKKMGIVVSVGAVGVKKIRRVMKIIPHMVNGHNYDHQAF